MAEALPWLEVVVAYSPAPRQVREWPLRLPAGATVGDALRGSGVLTAFPELASQPLAVGVWGRVTAPDRPLQPHDRVEVYRPLRVDPKLARRERFQRQGVRAAGLFSKKKAGPQAGS